MDNIETNIRRIERMESCFDELLRAAKYGPREGDKELLGELVAYYESGQWLCDYELDEKGALPRELKRGVLSQDGIYNLMEELKDHAYFL